MNDAMRRACSALTVLAFAHLHALPATGQDAAGRQRAVAGWAETGWIGAPAIRVNVKLDTGAATSSINAPRYREFERDGKPHVSFTLANGEGREVDIVQPVVRTVTIRRAGTGRVRRLVIRLKICVAGVTAETEFTLADRSGMDYPVLVGRAFLAEKILVESSRTFLASGLCGGD